MQPKIFVIGLDGATYDLILPWIEAGHLPTLKTLMEGGTYGPLRSTYPPLTGPAWSSFMTGRSPGNHGVFEFFHRQEGDYHQVLTSRLDIDGSSLWDLLSNAGLKVGVMGVPLTYPPEPVNGFLITGLLTPPERRDFTQPPELLEELETHLGKYLLRHDEKYRRSNPLPFIREQYRILKNNADAAIHLMQNKPWDFFMVHILGTDRMQHEFWHLIDPNHPQHDPAERDRLGDVVLDFFKEVDATVRRLLDHAGDAVIIVMSDHGFGPVYKFVNFNVWLLQQGFLQLKRTPLTWIRYALFKLGLNYNTIGHWILKLGLGKWAKGLGRGRREQMQRRLFLSLDDVDWSRTRAYSMGNFGQIYINLKGREPQGSVSSGQEYEALLTDLTQQLGRLSDPDTGRPIVERVFRRDEVYQGDHIHRAPDLMFFTRNMEYKAMGLSDFSSPHLFEEVFGTTGHHRMEGILVCHGPGIIEESKRISEARIYDLAPTILHMMGQPVPREMDGRVLSEIFTPEYQQAYPVTYTSEEENRPQSGSPAYTEEEEALLRERLRSLGYVN